jgi:hypothetical protein
MFAPSRFCRDEMGLQGVHFWFVATYFTFCEKRSEKDTKYTRRALRLGSAV